MTQFVSWIARIELHGKRFAIGLDLQVCASKQECA